MTQLKKLFSGKVVNFYPQIIANSYDTNHTNRLEHYPFPCQHYLLIQLLVNQSNEILYIIIILFASYVLYASLSYFYLFMQSRESIYSSSLPRRRVTYQFSHCKNLLCTLPHVSIVLYWAIKQYKALSWDEITYFSSDSLRRRSIGTSRW